MNAERILNIFVDAPLLALIPAAVFAFMFARTRRVAVGVAALAWAAYAAYELAIKMRIFCSGECNIRVDLLLVYPVLGLVSAAGVYVFFRTARERPGT